jgi:hypothetical protein
MDPFTAHPYQRGIAYFDHCCFVMGIALRFFASVLAFLVHAILPFVPIDPQLDLESTVTFLTKRNAWIEAAKKTVRVDRHMSFAASDCNDFDLRHPQLHSERRNVYDPRYLT